MEEQIIMTSIGEISSPYLKRGEAPPQGDFENEKVKATLKIFDEYKDGITGIEAGSMIIILFCFSKSEGFELMMRPRGKTELTGVFTSRSPRRPNSIGMTTVKVTAVHDGCIEFYGADMLDGTPVLDIKPVIGSIEPLPKK